MNKKKDIKGSDIILNLREIHIMDLNSFSSSGCCGPTAFNIDCETKHGYCEDPCFSGKIKILETKRTKKKGEYILKVKFEKEEREF